MTARSLVVLIVTSGLAMHPARGQTASPPDSVIARAHRLAAANDSAASRALLDSVISSATVDAMHRADAMYWLSRYAASAADRERILGAVIIDYPFSPRVPPALFELGMLELSRGDRDRSAVHLARFLNSSAQDTNRVGASLTLGKILLERGDIPRGCAVLLVGRAEVPAGAIEIRNQFEFSAARCNGVDTTTVVPQPAPIDTAPARVRTGAFTVQVAAYDQRGPADRLATRLRAQGLDARVIGKARPFRVRVGRYTTRAEAEQASQQVDAIAKSKSFVVVAGPEDS